MKRILQISIILIGLNSSIFSQADTNKICFPVETARKIALDLSRLDYLDSAIVLKDSIIAVKDTIITLATERLEVVEGEKIEAVEALTKEKPKKKWWGISGIILGLLSQLIF